MVYVPPVGFRPRSIPAALYQTRFQFNIEKGKTMGRLFLHRTGGGLSESFDTGRMPTPQGPPTGVYRFRRCGGCGRTRGNDQEGFR